MEAGPELDARVAEHVMGWTMVEVMRAGQPDGYAIGAAPGSLSPDGTGYRGAVPPYSTDISAAWLVVERLRELGWDVCVSTEAGTGMYHTVVLHPDQLCSEVVSVFGRTAPLSICLAALERLDSGAIKTHAGASRNR